MKGVVFEEPAETRVVIITLVEGAGDATVQSGDSVTVNYVGRLMDGTRAPPCCDGLARSGCKSARRAGAGFCSPSASIRAIRAPPAEFDASDNFEFEVDGGEVIKGARCRRRALRNCASATGGAPASG